MIPRDLNRYFFNNKKIPLQFTDTYLHRTVGQILVIHIIIMIPILIYLNKYKPKFKHYYFFFLC